MKPEQNGQHLADNTFDWRKYFVFWLNFSLKSVPDGPIDNILALLQVMAWCWPGDELANT